MAETIKRPTKWKIGTLLDTSRTINNSFPYRHASQGYVPGHGWCGIAGPDGKILSFEEPKDAQAWIDRQGPALSTIRASEEDR